MWFVKLFDYFEVSKLVFSSSCSLNRLLEANGFRVKTSHGMQAVEWAREKRWQELEDYCMQDTILTHQISSCDDVLIPLTGKRHVWHRRGRDGSHGFDYGDEEFEPLLPP